MTFFARTQKHTGPRGGRDRLFLTAIENGKIVGQITTADPLANLDKINRFFAQPRRRNRNIVDRCDVVLL